MSTYETLKGLKVKFLGADTSGDRLQEGEVFYNSADFNLKTFTTTSAWSAGTLYPGAKRLLAGLGTQTAAIGAGGSPSVATSFEYNGSGWSVEGDMNDAKHSLHGVGTSTAGLVFGGVTGSPAANNRTNQSEEYNGSTWSEGNNMNSARSDTSGAGLQTAAVAGFGVISTSRTNKTEEYNGTSWSEVNNTPVAADGTRGSGTLTAGLFTGGDTPDALATTFLYDGTNWTTGNNMPQVLGKHSASGTQTAGFIFGGNSNTDASEVDAATFDGTSWTQTSDMTTGRQELAGASGGSTTASLAFGGELQPGNTAATEEWHSQLATITAGAWSSGGNLTVGRESIRGGGLSQNAAWVAGGEAPGATVNSSEEYNGTAWTEGNNLNTARRAGGTGGSQTAALYTGGNTAPGGTPVTANSEEYNGTSWTEGNNLNTARGEDGNAGVQTSSLSVGGSADGGTNALNNSESYNGTSYSNETVFPTTGYGVVGTGTAETAALFAAGQGPYPGTNPTVRTWDGSSWTVISQDLSGIVQQTTRGKSFFNSSPYENADIVGGQSSSTFHGNWNGTVWSTRAVMSVGREASGAGTTTSGLATSGAKSGSGAQATEEWDGEASAITVKTVDFD